jgi:hydrogenase maturation protease
MKERVLIAGIGNIFLGDDAFGVEVVQSVADRFPSLVRVADFGIRGFDLAYALMDGYELAILVDAIPLGGSPGTLYAIQPELPARAARPEAFEAHSLTPEHVFTLVQVLGGSLPRLLVVGCEPTPLLKDEEALGRMGLSPPVQAAVSEAVKLIDSLVAEFLAEAETESARVHTSAPAREPLAFELLQKGGPL